MDKHLLKIHNTQVMRLERSSECRYRQTTGNHGLPAMCFSISCSCMPPSKLLIRMQEGGESIYFHSEVHHSYKV